jgi:hypothetical protein
MKKTKKKKTQTLTLSSDLPLIKIVSTEDEVFTKLELEMEASTHDMLVKWGKEVASDEDYISIAMRHGLEEYVDSLEESLSNEESKDDKSGSD